MKASKAAKRRALAKLDRGESLSTRDFIDLGYGMELFLRYASVPTEQAKRAEQALAKTLRADLGSE